MAIDVALHYHVGQIREALKNQVNSFQFPLINWHFVLLDSLMTLNHLMMIDASLTVIACIYIHSMPWCQRKERVAIPFGEIVEPSIKFLYISLR